jgi:hypothetical protein
MLAVSTVPRDGRLYLNLAPATFDLALLAAGRYGRVA